MPAEKIRYLLHEKGRYYYQRKVPKALLYHVGHSRWHIPVGDTFDSAQTAVAKLRSQHDELIAKAKSDPEERAKLRRAKEAREAKKLSIGDCCMAKASEILGDRWTLLILREAFYGVMRFADMQADIGVPRSILTTRLAKLVEAGLLEKFEYREDGARARQAYRLTERGQQLAVVFLAMKKWWDDGEAEPPVVNFFPKGTDDPVLVSLTDAQGQPVALKDIRLRID